MNDFIKNLIQSKQNVTVDTLAINGGASVRHSGVILSCDALGIVLDRGRDMLLGIPLSAIALVEPIR